MIWSKGSIILAAGEVVVADDKRITLSSTDLIIEDVTSKDAGDYTCKTTSQRAAEVTHTLRVFGKREKYLTIIRKHICVKHNISNNFLKLRFL